MSAAWDCVFTTRAGAFVRKQAFTLLELLLVIAIFIILLWIVFWYTGITRNLIAARDVERARHSREIEHALYQHLIDTFEFPNEPEIPVGEPNAKPICRYGVTGDPTCVVLDPLVPTYLAGLPVDPAETNPNYTGYYVYRNEDQFAFVSSPFAGDTDATEYIKLFSTWAANGYVAAIEIHDGVIYIGGDFSEVYPLAGGASVGRNRLAAFDMDGNLLPWDPGSNGYVHSIDAADGIIYVAGKFSSVAGASRFGFAAVDTDGNITPWDPDVDVDSVSARVVVHNDLVYIGGEFTQVKTSTLALGRGRVAAITRNGAGTITAWDPGASDKVHNITIYGGLAYLAGNFTELDPGGLGSPVTRNRLAAVTLDGTGTVTAWDPNADDRVTGMVMHGDTIYIGGYFENVGGQPRGLMAAVDRETGAVTSWSPSVDGLRVEGMYIYGNTLYFGGYFWTVSGEARNSVAAVSILDGSLRPWNPDASDPDPSCPEATVHTLGVTASRVYIGGCFRQLGGNNIPYFAVLSP